MESLNKDLRITTAFLATLILLCVLSCKKSEELSNAEVLKGKYNPISAYADHPVDINFDGFESIDLLQEIPDIKTAQLELIGTDGYNLYSHFWPEPYFLYAEPSDIYNPEIKVVYAKKASYGKFHINKDFTEIIVPDKSLLDFVSPSKILILSDNDVSIFFNKRIYTKSGWQDLKINVIYKSYTTTY
ncbi:hypothetical protein ADIARSV_2114 [Arcticibacter svalbardensis MN12-7]|uniref:Uncharacterized protein n=1 Tax=Arcticibacter svalbardensis MN12-7 TaxID=1150600 RepID=R9GT81_9SPHI|nr:hypothetical protein [Arcticibacter svalbardensis]EOR94740.1 hypothetical protein ADIARSV_2114 [Arcticibacter svalbardensis MN12-7]